MKIIRTHIIRQTERPMRLEDYIRFHFQDLPSRKGIQKSIKRGLVHLDGQTVTPGIWVKAGQRIDWLEEELNQKTIYRQAMTVNYEDDYLAVIVKPAGIPVSGNRHRTVAHALSYFLKPSSQPDKLAQPQPAHRLDVPTSGLLIVAKTASVLVALNRLFESKKVKKEYLAIVQGKMPESGRIASPVAGKSALTEYVVTRYSRSLSNEWLSVVKLIPHTGRTHQLRIHLAALSHPIVGDREYGVQGDILKGKGLFLCALAIEFSHPVSTQLIQCRMDPPAKFENLLLREQHRWKRFYEQ